MQEYRICSRCVMDTTDPEITFDNDGVCNHCIEFEEVTSKSWYPNDEGKQKLDNIISKIKKEGARNDYDCIIGLSGGVDSSYLALIAREWGLRPLVVHVDAGWNSELAVANIEKIVKYCNYHLHTHVVDWSEMRDLHLAYLKAGIANQDVVQDHIFFSSLYHFATQNRIKYILSGGNIATEGIFPSSWHGSAMDAINLNAIHRKYGKQRLRHYKTISFFQYYIWYPFVKKMRTFRPLNYMPYNKNQAIAELESKIGWRNYGRKHGESLFTKFFQNHYLPQKFGFDKRRPHLSSLIVTDQITRDEAIEMLKIPLYDPQELEKDIQFLCKKLKISRDEYEEIMKAPIHSYKDFPNWDKLQNLVKKGSRFYNKFFGKKITVYS